MTTLGHCCDQSDIAPPHLALRPKAAARALGIGERKLWGITADQSSGIPHVRFGNAIVSHIHEIRRWLADHAARGGDDD